jgi:hypothetical protein
MPKCVSLGFSSIVLEEEGWCVDTLYRLQAVEQGNIKEQVSFSKDR